MNQIYLSQVYNFITEVKDFKVGDRAYEINNKMVEIQSKQRPTNNPNFVEYDVREIPFEK